MYPQPTQRMGAGAMMTGATSQIPPVEDYGYAGRNYDYAGQRAGGGGTSRRWIPWVLGLVIVIGVVAGVAYYLLVGGGAKYAVPLVNGEPVAQAQTQISAAHLRSTVVQQANANVSKGLVIKSNPAEGNNVPANTVVTLYVSTGAAPVAVPSVIGQTQTNATQILQAKGFNVSVKSDPTSSQPTGQVISQSPNGGTAPPGATVTITVSGGAVSVPSVIGDSQATATQILTQAGFKVSAQQGSGSAQYPNGTVFSQVPGSGSAAKGSTIIIYVQNGASPSASPSSSDTGSPTAPASGGTGGGNGNGGGGGGGGLFGLSR